MSDLKQKSEFKKVSEYYQYLVDISPAKIAMTTIRNRITRDGLTPEEAISRPTNQKRPHPYRTKRYNQKAEIGLNHEK